MSAGVELKNVTRKVPEYESRYLIGSQYPTPDAQGRGASSNAAPENRPPANEYDIIKETGQRGRSTQREQTENALYGDHGTLPVAHPTLTAEKKERDSARSSSRLIQSGSPPLLPGNNRITCGGGSVPDCILFVVLSLALFVALGALVLVLLLYTGAYIPPGSTGVPLTTGHLGEATTAPMTSTSPTTPTNAPAPTNHSNDSNITSVNYQMVLDQLNSAVQNLSIMLDALTSQVVLNQSAISTRINSLTASGNALDLSTCQTSISTCQAPSMSCITTLPDLPMNTFVMSVFCAVTNTGGETKPITATLFQDPNTGYFCLCQRVFVRTPSTTIHCSIYQTTCPIVTGTLTVT